MRRDEPLLKPLLKSARERPSAFHTGSGGCTAIEKFGELERNREEACFADRIERNGNLGAHYTGFRGGAPGYPPAALTPTSARPRRRAPEPPCPSCARP